LFQEKSLKGMAIKCLAPDSLAEPLQAAGL
jgi:hypothetical protein